MRTLEEIIGDIRELEQELLQELQKKQDEYFYIIKGKRIEFEEETRRYHKTLAKTLGRYFAEAQLVHIMTAPVIYLCLIPALLMDLVVSNGHVMRNAGREGSPWRFAQPDHLFRGNLGPASLRFDPCPAE